MSSHSDIRERRVSAWAAVEISVMPVKLHCDAPVPLHANWQFAGKTLVVGRTTLVEGRRTSAVGTPAEQVSCAARRARAAPVATVKRLPTFAAVPGQASPNARSACHHQFGGSPPPGHAGADGLSE